MALLEFLAATARTGIIPANLGAFAAKRMTAAVVVIMVVVMVVSLALAVPMAIATDVEPLTVIILLEVGGLVMVPAGAILGVGRDEFDDAVRISRAALLGANNLKALERS